jgi:hypothetical protein
MPRLDSVVGLKVGDRPSDLQDPIVGPGRQAQLVHGQLDQFPSVLIETAILFELTGPQLRVAEYSVVLIPFLLYPARVTDPFAEGRRILPHTLHGQIPKRNRRHFHMNIDTVE